MATTSLARRCRGIIKTQSKLAQQGNSRQSGLRVLVNINDIITRWQSTQPLPLSSSRLEIQHADLMDMKPKPPVDQLAFGKIFTDHMLTIDWSAEEGWAAPQIQPFANFSIHPGSKVLHYAQELFEGMKAYRGVDGKIRLFRPMHNMARMNLTASRACLPLFDGHELVECIRRLVVVDQEWVPHDTSSSLYIRPTMIGLEPTLGVAPANSARLFVLMCPVGPYYATGFKPVNLLADPQYVRAWPGGSGYTKMGSNYAPTLWTQKVAEQHGCHQCLWLFGEDHEITEVGAMNLFILLAKKDGSKELVTPPISSGIILPGVTRRSIVEITQNWPGITVSERKITMGEVMAAREDGTLLEMFGSGTAAVVSPVGGLHYQGELRSIPTPRDGIAAQIMATMSDIYYGRVSSPWALDVEDWSVDPAQELADYQQPEAVQSMGLQ